MTYLFRSWKESLLIFLPKNAKLFFLVVLKTIIRSYKILFRDCWWLVALSIISEVIYDFYFGVASYFVLFPLFFWLITIFCMYLIIRPSVHKKNVGYYLQHKSHFLYYLSASFIMHAVAHALVLIGSYIVTKQALPPLISLILFLPFLTIPFLSIYTTPLVSFFLFFILDKKSGIRNFCISLVQAFKMLFYNYPFCFILLSLFFGVYAAMNVVMHHFFGNTGIVITLYSYMVYLLLPIPISIWSIFYTKRLHDQFGLYYPESIKE